MNRYDAIVIGAGANGLATAALLARKLDRVLVLEARDTAGGTNATEEFHPGFRANACRDDAGWLPEALVRQLALARHGLQWASPPAGLAAIGPDHPPQPTYADVSRTVDAIRAYAPQDAARWSDFAAFVNRAAGFLESAYALRAPRVQSRALGDLMALAGLGRRLRKLGKREMMDVLRVVPMPIADLIDEWFSSAPLRAMLAVAGTRDVMHGPMSGGTALVFLHQQVGQPAGSIGVRRVPRGGLGALSSAFAAAAREAGVEIRLAAEVSEVLVDAGRASGVRLTTGEELAATHVVSSADPRRSFSWIDPVWLDPELLRAVDNIRLRGSTARIHVALEALPRVISGGQEVPRDALGGTMTVATSLKGVERAYDAAKFGEFPESPALTLTIPSLVDPSLAPDRKHVLSVSVHHTPFALKGGWTPAAADALADRIMSLLAPVMPDLADKALHRWVLTPGDLEARYGCTEGNLSHGEIALDQFLFMRPVPQCSRYATPLPGFWLCGTGTHPASASGAGATLVAREVLAARQPAAR